MEAATADAVGASRPLPQDVRVRAFAAGDEADWDRFVDGIPDATFFHRAAWRDVIGCEAHQVLSAEIRQHA